MSKDLDRSSREAIEQFISLTRRCLTPIKGYSDMVELYLRAVKDHESTEISPEMAHHMITVVQDYTGQFTNVLEEWLEQVRASYQEETRDESDV
jgi:hypothetical protein